MIPATIFAFLNTTPEISDFQIQGYSKISYKCKHCDILFSSLLLNTSMCMLVCSQARPSGQQKGVHVKCLFAYSASGFTGRRIASQKWNVSNFMLVITLVLIKKYPCLNTCRNHNTLLLVLYLHQGRRREGREGIQVTHSKHVKESSPPSFDSPVSLKLVFISFLKLQATTLKTVNVEVTYSLVVRLIDIGCHLWCTWQYFEVVNIPTDKIRVKAASISPRSLLLFTDRTFTWEIECSFDGFDIQSNLTIQMEKRIFWPEKDL